VLQGDPLSAAMFNLSIEPLLRSLQQCPGQAKLYDRVMGVSAFADDIALAFESSGALQTALEEAETVARKLGLAFRPGKCATLSSHDTAPFTLSAAPLPQVGPDETHQYLGVPVGLRTTFTPANQLAAEVDKVVGSLLHPAQKIDAIRAFLAPKLNYHLSTGLALKDSLSALDRQVRAACKSILDLPDQASSCNFYASRSVGGLGLSKFTEDADVWQCARALRMICSNDSTIAHISRHQVREGLKRLVPSPSLSFLGKYLSGSMEGDLARLRYFGSSAATLWSRARLAAKRLGARVHLSANDAYVSVDEILSTPAEAVRGLRLAVRNRHTARLCSQRSQGQAAKAVAELDPAPKELARILSPFSTLPPCTFRIWVRGRLRLLPSLSQPWSRRTNEEQRCRLCHRCAETNDHVVSGCRNNLLVMERHNRIKNFLFSVLPAHCNAQLEKQLTRDDRVFRPDIAINRKDRVPAYVDVTLCAESVEQLNAAVDRKVAKYSPLGGRVLPVVVGAWGAWHRQNDQLRLAAGIAEKQWAHVRRRIRFLAIEGSVAVAFHHLQGQQIGRTLPT